MTSENQNQQTALTLIEQDERAFALLQRKASAYTSSNIVPAQYQGKDNIGNTIIALDMANRLNANPLMVMQNLYIVHGNPGWSSKFLVATINASGKFTPLRYEFRGKEGEADWGCRAFAYEAGDKDRKERLDGEWITMAMAQAEGWTTKSGSKWKTMPGQMLRYRAAAFWQRVYAPEISMGLVTAEELRDMPPQRTVEDADAEEVVADPTEGLVDKETGEILQPAAQQQEGDTFLKPETAAPRGKEAAK